MNLGSVVGAGTIGVGLAAVAIEVGTIVLALQAHAHTRRFAGAWAAGNRPKTVARARTARFLLMSAAVAPLLVLVRMVTEIEGARMTILESVTSPDLAQKVSPTATALVRELGATFGGMLSFGVTLVLGSVAAGVAASARVRQAGLAHATEIENRDREAALAWAARPGPDASALIAAILGFVLLGAGPLIAGALTGTWLKLQAIGEVALASPDMKVALYEQAQRSAGTFLERGYLASMAGVACATIGSAALFWFGSPARARARMLGRQAPAPLPSGGGIFPVAATVGAIALVLLARPIRRENEQPWPPGSPNERLGVATPALDGPDRPDLGPLIAVTSTGLSLERAPQDAAGVEAGLRAYRARFPLLHPGEPAPREILIACAPDADSTRMFAMLETAHRAGYDRARLIFETPRQVLRPVMGKVVLRELTAAHVSIGAGGDAAAGEFVRPGDAATCGQLAARVVALRRAGLSVVLAPGASAP